VTSLCVVEVGDERADDVRAVIGRAFGARPRLDPPSTALEETTESVASGLGAAGGLLVLHDGAPVGAAMFDTAARPGRLGLRRVSVDPAHQGHGVASALVGVAEEVAELRGLDGVWLTARAELPDTVSFWLRRGYVETGCEGPSLELAKTLELVCPLPSAADTRAFGARLAELLRAGDLVVLTGGLGAGKTTLTQGLGEGLRVRGAVTSPTFVISRVHASTDGGPELVHVDAYRLGAAAELDDLDLDSTLPDAVTVVEWGEGLAEGLADSWLEIGLTWPGGAVDGTDPREVRVRPIGARWAATPLRSTLLG